VKRINALVEGQTEETFVRAVLAPFFYARNIHIRPTVVTTRPGKHGPDFRGGLTSYWKVRRDLLRLLSDHRARAVSTMFDYYGLPADFPGMDSVPEGTCHERVGFLERALQEDINSDRFIPFIMLHEFEALLFVAPLEFDRVFPSGRPGAALAEIRHHFHTPEEINRGLHTHPSARILSLIPIYRKRLHGVIIARRIGLRLMREQCPHFNAWIEKLSAP